MKRGMITGITGQDGSYLWVAEGREVIRQGVREFREEVRSEFKERLEALRNGRVGAE